MERKKPTSGKRAEIINRMAGDIKSGRAGLDRFAVKLQDKVRCGICSREGRNMVRMIYADGGEEYLGKTCARYLVEHMEAEGLSG